MTGRETLNRLMQVRRACTCPMPGDEREWDLAQVRRFAERVAYDDLVAVRAPTDLCAVNMDDFWRQMARHIEEVWAQ